MDLLTLELATRLTSRYKGRIPLKVHPSATDASHNRHWRRANLIGIQGKNVIIRPINSTTREETVSPDSCKLWETRLTPDLLILVNQIKSEIEEEKFGTVEKVTKLGKPVYQHIPYVPEPIPGPEVLPDLIPEPVALAAVTEPIIVEKTEIEKPVIPVAPKPSDFARQLQEYKRLKDDLAKRAQTDGLMRLRQLHTDLKEAIQMVSLIETEISTVCNELDEFSVPIPDDLQLTTSHSDDSGAISKAIVLEPEQDEPSSVPNVVPISVQKKRSRGTVPSNWCSGKARKYREQIRQFLVKFNNEWMTGKAIMQAVGEPTASPTSILLPLVDDGLLERDGAVRGQRYRLAGQAEDYIEES